jgi:hypothetical protein
MLVQQGQHEAAQREMAHARGERGPAWWIMRIGFLVMLKGAIIWKLIQWMAARP